MSNMLTFPAKKIRSRVIKEFILDAGYRGAICFTCGNAANELREVGVDVLEISPYGPLSANKWWNPASVHKVWPDLFDATSGHLPVHLMVKISVAFREYLGELIGEYDVPTGSGETIVCLRWAYPDCRFNPIYGLNESTKFNPEAPLVAIVGLQSPYQVGT